jgi:membrane protein YdbS with pleckstrin-like domain
MPSAEATLLAEVRTDVGPSTWGAGALLTLGAAVMIAGVFIPPLLVPGLVIGGAFALGAAVVGLRIASARSVVFRVTSLRIEIERGYLAKRYESLDLFRVKDVVLEQGLIDRIRSVGKLTVYSTDAVDPVLEIGPVADAKALYQKLRDAVADARRRTGAAVLQ